MFTLQVFAGAVQAVALLAAPAPPCPSQQLESAHSVSLSRKLPPKFLILKSFLSFLI